MKVYRIVKAEKRSRDLSGTGAFRFGGRWNSAGTYMLYTSENSSLAYLETLVHVDESNLPSNLLVTTIQIKDDKLIYTVKDDEYPVNWQKLDNIENKQIGDKWMKEVKYLGFKVKSAVNPSEYNYLLNPLFPGFPGLVEVFGISPLEVDMRLVKMS